MTKKEIRLTHLVFLFLGIVIGFLLSPIKEGTYIVVGSDNVQGRGLKRKRRESDEDTGH